ncbi:hypothetical protein SCG7086_BA_00150 [Chlamydiales bacterium SCGC AG-110-P3]|nr:hypothetical protein SCG7086_BA_00150 [Chlamydiales bacterium SCGC AG-110-P3]
MTGSYLRYACIVVAFAIQLFVTPLYGTGAYAPITTSAESIAFDETVTVSVQLPLEPQISIKQLTEEFSSNQTDKTFAIVDAYRQTNEGTDRRSDTVVLILEPWEPGRHAITFGTLVINDKKDPLHIVTGVEYVTVAAPTVAVNQLPEPRLLPIPGRPLLGVEPETWQRLSDNADHNTDQAQRHLNTFQERSFPWIIFVLLSLLITAVYLFRRLGGSLLYRLQHDGMYTESPRNKALQALDRLMTENLPAQERYDSFYVILTAIVRRYIEDTFGLKAPEHTTEEFLREAVESKIFEAGTQEQLSHFLEYADLVKFAQVNPTTTECDDAMNSARTLVKG